MCLSSMAPPEIKGKAPLEYHSRFIQAARRGVPVCIPLGLTGLALAAAPLKHSGDSALQRRQIALDHFPDAGQVDAEIVVDEDIPKACDGEPGDIGVCRLQLGGEALGRFGEFLEFPEGCLLSLAIGEEALAALGRVRPDGLKAFAMCRR
jgi:hypothetical protein